MRHRTRRGRLRRGSSARSDHAHRSRSSAGPEATHAKVAVSPLNGATIPLGNHPWNTGGKPGRSGRPPSLVRAACREAFDDRIPLLRHIADGLVPLRETCPRCGFQGEPAVGGGSDVDERLRALDTLGKYGLGERTGLDREAVEESLRVQRDIIRELLPAEQATALLERLAEAWG
jgi:hypothetical protein